MELDEILEALDSYSGKFPREALREAMARREEITPVLLGILEDTAQHVEALDEDPEYMAYEWAMFLLAQFRETRAYPLIVDLVSGPSDIIEDALGDMLTEDLDRILASVFNGDTRPLKRLIEDPDVNEWVRSAALDALVILVAAGRLPREEVIAYFGSLFHADFDPEDDIWTFLVSAASDLSPAELMDDIRLVLADGRADPTVADLAWVEKSVAGGWDAALAKLREDRYYQFINDVEKETEWWAAWKPQPDRAPAPSAAALRPTAPSETYVREGRKIGRNEPCPCGSGKKYKKCCGR